MVKTIYRKDMIRETLNIQPYFYEDLVGFFAKIANKSTMKKNAQEACKDMIVEIAQWGASREVTDGIEQNCVVINLVTNLPIEPLQLINFISQNVSAIYDRQKQPATDGKA
jgi:hypothetical protein